MRAEGAEVSASQPANQSAQPSQQQHRIDDIPIAGAVICRSKATIKQAESCIPLRGPAASSQESSQGTNRNACMDRNIGKE